MRKNLFLFQLFEITQRKLQMKGNKKYSIRQKVALKAAVDGIPQMVIINQLSDALGVTVRTVYNYINTSFKSDGLVIEKLEIIAMVLGCEVSELYAQSEILA